MRSYTLGFTLIELMIVISIISILAVIGIPSYQQYTQRARFVELVSTARAYQTAISVAIQSGAPINELTQGKHGIPLAPNSTANLSSLTVKNGVITATATKAIHQVTYILKPNEQGSTWSIDGTCLKSGLCHA